MGSRKHTSAERRKEEKKSVAFASLRNCPTSPRKMRLVTELIRGKDVDQALYILKTCSKEPAIRLRKLLLSAMANWQVKNEGSRIEESGLFIKTISVDSGRVLKRIRPAPQGRAHRIRKRSNHVTMVLDNRVDIPVEETENTNVEN
jgi:large subunit ribosomal protein L22